MKLPIGLFVAALVTVIVMFVLILSSQGVFDNDEPQGDYICLPHAACA